MTRVHCWHSVCGNGSVESVGADVDVDVHTEVIWLVALPLTFAVVVDSCQKLCTHE